LDRLKEKQPILANWGSIHTSKLQS